MVDDIARSNASKKGLRGRCGRVHVHVNISKLSKFKVERVMDSLRSKGKVWSLPLLFSGWAGPIIMVVDIVKDSRHIVSLLLSIENFGHHVRVVVTGLAMCGQ